MMNVVMAQLMAMLNDPAVVAIVTPMLVKLFSDCLSKVNVAMPNGLKPVLAIVCGAVASACGDMSLMTGSMSGVAGVGIRELLKPLTRGILAGLLKK
jgi:hypothetical protein